MPLILLGKLAQDGPRHALPIVITDFSPTAAHDAGRVDVVHRDPAVFDAVPSLDGLTAKLDADRPPMRRDVRVRISSIILASSIVPAAVVHPEALPTSQAVADLPGQL